jgi:hypothetical protein
MPIAKLWVQKFSRGCSVPNFRVLMQMQLWTKDSWLKMTNCICWSISFKINLKRRKEDENSSLKLLLKMHEAQLGLLGP